MTHRSLTLLIAACGSAIATAAPLTPQEALARFNTNAPRALRGDATRGVTLTRTIRSAGGEAALYLFNTSTGFAILPADDVAVPLLGYGSSTLTPGELPPAMQE